MFSFLGGGGGEGAGKEIGELKWGNVRFLRFGLRRRVFTEKFHGGQYL